MLLLLLLFSSCSADLRFGEALVYNTTLGPSTTVLDDRGVADPYPSGPACGCVAWQPPESREPWSDVLDVSAIAPICKQASASFPSDATTVRTRRLPLCACTHERPAVARSTERHHSLKPDALGPRRRAVGDAYLEAATTARRWRRRMWWWW